MPVRGARTNLTLHNPEDPKIPFKLGSKVELTSFIVNKDKKEFKNALMTLAILKNNIAIFTYIKSYYDNLTFFCHGFLLANQGKLLKTHNILCVERRDSFNLFLKSLYLVQ